MSYRNDKISDILAILNLMKKDFNKASYYRNISELRKEAVQEYAEEGLSTNRFKNRDSAYKTIHDACGRRLKPDIDNIFGFDRIAEEWLSQNSPKLKRILLRHSRNYWQKERVNGFFC